MQVPVCELYTEELQVIYIYIYKSRERMSIMFGNCRIVCIGWQSWPATLPNAALLPSRLENLIAKTDFEFQNYIVGNTA